MPEFLIANEIAKDLPLQRVEVTTPMNEQSAGYIIPENMNPILIDILGAAEPFTRGLEDAFENSPHALISARRRGHKIEDLIVETRYERLPRLDGKPLIFVDPALATALTLSGAYKKLVDGENKYGRIEGPIYIASIVATPFAMKRLRETIGDRLRGLYAVSCDLLLTEKGYIHGPGLNGIGGGGIGDAGDRFLGVIPVD